MYHSTDSCTTIYIGAIYDMYVCMSTSSLPDADRRCDADIQVWTQLIPLWAFNISHLSSSCQVRGYTAETIFTQHCHLLQPLEENIRRNSGNISCTCSTRTLSCLSRLDLCYYFTSHVIFIASTCFISPPNPHLPAFKLPDSLVFVYHRTFIFSCHTEY